MHKVIIVLSNEQPVKYYKSGLIILAIPDAVGVLKEPKNSYKLIGRFGILLKK